LFIQCIHTTQSDLEYLKSVENDQNEVFPLPLHYWPLLNSIHLKGGNLDEEEDQSPKDQDKEVFSLFTLLLTGYLNSMLAEGQHGRT
jgi:hypothetical protein